MEAFKVLYLDSWDAVGDFFRNERNKIRNVTSVSLYRSNSIVNKIFRILGKKINIIFYKFAYGNWINEIIKYDLIILESRKSFEYAIKYINKHYPNKRVVVWYWNEVTGRELYPNYIRQKYNCETWTFDKNDSLKYNMYYNNTYYFDIPIELNSKLENDVFYIGIDREGRIEVINKLNELFNYKKISFVCYLAKSPLRKPNNNYKYSKYLSYYKVLEKVKKSVAILDLTKKTQYGLTLRPMEAIFLKKKLITDNKNIKLYDFYNKDNVFIIGEDNDNNIELFMKKKYKEIPKNIKDKYLFEKWLERIKEKKEYF